jgi:hypothetical protein
MDTALPKRDMPDWPVAGHPAVRRHARRARRRRHTDFRSQFNKFNRTSRGRVLLASLAATIVGAMIWQATPPSPAIEQPVLEAPRASAALSPSAPTHSVRKHIVHTKHHGRRSHHKPRHSR